MSKTTVNPIKPVIETDVGSMLFNFSDWSNNLKLCLAGREYFSRLAKNYQKCDVCGVYFKKDEEVW